MINVRPVAAVQAALFVVTAVAVSLAALTQKPAQAFPAYSKKEGKPCAFCHVNASGGGKRNAAGIYYKAHNLSLVGFGAAPAAAKPAVPTAKPAAKPKSAGAKAGTKMAPKGKKSGKPHA